MNRSMGCHGRAGPGCGVPWTWRTGVWGATGAEDRGAGHRGCAGLGCGVPRGWRTGAQGAVGMEDRGVGRHGRGGWEHKRQKGQPGEASQLRVRSVCTLCMTIFKCSGKPLEGFQQGLASSTLCKTPLALGGAEMNTQVRRPPQWSWDEMLRGCDREGEPRCQILGRKYSLMRWIRGV